MEKLEHGKNINTKQKNEKCTSPKKSYKTYTKESKYHIYSFLFITIQLSLFHLNKIDPLVNLLI